MEQTWKGICMTKLELLSILEKVDDDFEIELFNSRRLSNEELDGWSYPVVWDRYTIDGIRDIGYSDKTISFEIKESK